MKERKSLQQLLREGLEEARELHEVAVKSGNDPGGNFSDFCARHLVQVLTPVMTAIQEHIESCPVTFESYEISNSYGAGLPEEAKPIPPIHVQAALSVDGRKLSPLAPPPFYTRSSQEEISKDWR